LAFGKGETSILALAVVCLVGLTSGCARDAAPRGPLNLVLILVDTLRADRLSGYGNPRPTSPALDRLARRGVLFERAGTATTWTLPAVSTLFTSHYPLHHGVTTVDSRLPEAERTLAEVLADGGWSTRAVVSHFYLSDTFNTMQGFEEVVNAGVGKADAATSEAVTDSTLAVIDRAVTDPDGRPFFVLAHYFDPHSNYLRHDAWPWEKDLRPERLPENGTFPDLQALGGGLSPAEIAWALALYDGEVAATDHGIGRLLEGLTERGLDGRTVVMMTGDHGEEFNPSGRAGHIYWVHESILNVPLIVAHPEGRERGRVSRERVGLVDLLPTIVDFLGVEADTEGWEGRSLAHLVVDPETTPDDWAQRTMVAEVTPTKDGDAGPNLRAALRNRWKLERRVRSGRELLYDLEADPGERTSVADDHPEVHAELAAVLDEWEASTAAKGEVLARLEDAGTAAITEEERERLRALGYLD
jgi:arylsulfatase A-like enzyme